jgi:hypothetical protein
MKVLLPHWFDDVVKLGIAGLPTAGYEWPDPKYLRGEAIDDGDGPGGVKGSAKKTALSAEKKKLFQSAGWMESPPSVASSTSEATSKNVWAGRMILLSASLELSGGRREAVEVGIERAGGVVISCKNKHKGGAGDAELEEELRRVGSADVLITRYRYGATYLKVRSFFPPPS